MKEIVKIITGYIFEELNPNAKEHVINAEREFTEEIYSEEFFDTTMQELKENFPFSDLKLEYSLNYCQGDGLNIYGELNIKDFIPFWNASEKEKRTILYYYGYLPYIELSSNRARYCYSYKFLDKQLVEDYVEELKSNLYYNNMSGIKADLIRKFYNDLFDYFEELDTKYEKLGYEYIYSFDETEFINNLNAENAYFDAYGERIA